ncbi:hypothetical protein EV359DRAFT_87398 [Lentinula novae-zelandiae]|nr:hypothetical protein EV359DRAFT_87398 [Lentinula novae-zelandiae]
MLFGLCLRFVLNPSHGLVHPTLYAALVGVWEGVCLRYLITGDGSSLSSLSVLWLWDSWLWDFGFGFGCVVGVGGGPVVGVCGAVLYGLFRDGGEGWDGVGGGGVECCGGGGGGECWWWCWGRGKGGEGNEGGNSHGWDRGVGVMALGRRLLEYRYPIHLLRVEARCNLPTSSAHSNQHPSPLPLPLPLSSFTTPPRSRSDQLQFQFQSKDPKDPGDDDLQMPLPQSRFLIPDDDELQTPLALFPIISSLPIPVHHSTLLLCPIPSTSASPVPVPAPGIPYITTDPSEPSKASNTLP